MLGQDEFKDGASVVVEATNDGEIGGNLVLESYGFKQAKDLIEFGNALFEGGVFNF